MKKTKRWYCYRNFKTGMDLKRDKPSLFLRLAGYRLVEVVDYYVDEKAVKVGGGV